MAGVGSIIGSQLKTHAYPILGGIVSGGAVYAVASRVFPDEQGASAGLGVAAGSLVAICRSLIVALKAAVPKRIKPIRVRRM